jgi:hypothetical protein
MLRLHQQTVSALGRIKPATRLINCDCDCECQQ